MSYYSVYNGRTSTGIVLNASDYMYVSSGGVANSTTVNSGGYLHVSSGGTANSNTLNYGGWMLVSSGGTADSTTVNSGGYLRVYNWGVANSTTVNASGYLHVSSGGTATNIVENGGYVDVRDGANVTFVSNTFSGLVLSYASATLHSGTTANSTTVNSSGYLHVSSGGTANSTTVNSSGYLYVSSGGVANSTTLSGYSACLTVSSGGTANSTTVNWGSMYVSSGGTADSTIVNSYGDLFVSSGGMVNSTTVNSGYMYVSSGATADSATVNFGGNMTVAWGGSATNIVENGGYVHVDVNAYVTFTPNTFSGLELSYYSPATVHSGTTAVGITVNSHGSMLVFSGGTAVDIVENGGYVDVADGADVTFAPNTFSGLDISYASATVHSGTSARDVIIGLRGYLAVFSGGTAVDIVENGGYVDVNDGARITFTPNTFSGLELSHESATAHSGTIAVSTAINSYASMYVFSGGSANSTTVNSSGYLFVSSGGTALNIVENGGYVEVADSADVTFTSNTFSGLELSYYSSATVHSGTTADSTTVNWSGHLYVFSGGTASSTTVNNRGCMTVSSGGRVTGMLTLHNGAVVSTYEGSIIDFDISGLEPSAPARVNDLSLVQGAPAYTITVSANQAEGTYKLAEGASGFTGTVIVRTEDTVIGVLSAGDRLSATAQKEYSLSLSSGILSFTVFTDIFSPDAPLAVADITVPTNQDVTVTADFSEDSVQKQYSLDGENWSEYTGGVVMSANGTVWFRGIDAAGNISEVASYAVTNIDKIPPVKPVPQASTEAPLNRDCVTVSAAFSEDSVQRQYSLDGENWTEYTAGIVFSANGTVWFRGIDEVGNISEVTSYTVVNIADAQVGFFRGDLSSAELISAADVLTGKTVDSTDDLLLVYSGGTADATTIVEGGSMTVFSGGMTNETTVGDGGAATISGGTASSTVVSSGGLLDVSSGGTACQTTISKGGAMCISSGGTASDVIWEKEGGLTVESSAVLSIATIRDDNALTVSEGTIVNSITVSSAGKLEITSGGLANFVNVASSGTFEIRSGGVANGVYVSRYGSLTADSGAVVSGLYVLSRGGIYELQIPDETAERDPDTGEYPMKTVSSAGVQTTGVQIYNANLYSSARLSCLESTVVSGGSIGSNAQLYLGSGAAASGVSVDRMGTLYVDNGGSAFDTRLEDDGRMIVLGEAYGISAAGASLCLGDSAFAVYDEAGWPTSNSYEEDIHASGTVLNSSWMLVYYGASATETEVTSNSWQHVYWGGSARNTDITSSGFLTVHQSGTADTVDLHSGGYMRLYTGAIVKGNVNVGGEVTVWKAGTSATEDVIRAYGAKVNFVLNERNGTEAKAIVSDLGMIMGATYFVTVSTSQASGTYKLGTGATDFDASITVRTERGTTLGTVRVGQNLSSDGCTYTLVKENDLLSLTVSGTLDVKENLAEDDLNGDGRADIVMTITESGHGAEGATGAWLIQNDQTAAWGDLSQRNPGWSIFGMGTTSANKTTNDVYVKSTGNVIGAWTTDESGKVAGWETVGEFDASTQVLGLGDFNGNGQTDLLLRNQNGAVGCYFTGGEKTGWNYFQSLGDEWKISAVGDLNGDGRADVVLKHDAGFAGSWLTQDDYTMAWADLDTLQNGFEIVGAGDFNGDGTDDVLLKNGSYYGAWLVQNGNATGWMGLGDLGAVTVEQIADFNGDGTDDLRIRTASGDLGAQLVKGADTLDWKYYGSVGSEWSTGLAAV